MQDDSSYKSISLVIGSDLKNVSFVTNAMRGICSSLSLGDVDSYYIELSVAEAVNNAIQHAYNCELGHNVEINIRYSSSEITIQISDTGKKLEICKACFPDFDPCDIKALPQSGMGLYIINTVMDTVSYQSMGGKNTLIMQKRLRYNKETK